MVKIVFLGTPLFSRIILDDIKDYFEIEAIVTQPDREKKNGKIKYSLVKEFALENNILLFQPNKLSEIKEELSCLESKVLITAAFGKIIPQSILDMFDYKINVHGSILPRRRGAAPIQRAIMEGDSELGISLIEMVKELDAGRIYKIEKIDYKESDNFTTVLEKMAHLGSKMLKENVLDIISNKNIGYEQDHLQSTYCNMIDNSEEKIDFTLSAKDVYNKIRAFSYTPGAYFIYQDKKYKILKCEIEFDLKDNSIPFTIKVLKDKLLIKCSDYYISVLEIKPEGKKMLLIKDFLNGQRVFKNE